MRFSRTTKDEPRKSSYKDVIKGQGQKKEFNSEVEHKESAISDNSLQLKIKIFHEFSTVCIFSIGYKQRKLVKKMIFLTLGIYS